MISIATVANALASIVSVVEATQKLYAYGADLMEATEKAYSGVSGAGGTKKAAVIAALKAFAETIGAQWGVVEAQVSAWIDTVKSAYNSLTATHAAA